MPSHLDIQSALVEMKDKAKSHIGSSEWLGSTEVSLCMSYFVDADCQIINVPTGSDLKS